MKTKTALPCLLAASSLIAFGFETGAAEIGAGSTANQLTPAEKAAGWKLLFDGKTLNGWHSFKKKEPPKQGWVIEGDWLKCVANGHGGDLVSDDEFDDFELSWDWRIPPKAKYGTASFYDVLPPKTENALKPPGESNQSRVLVQGNHVEHWLNGSKVLEYELGSETVKAAVAKSKFKTVPGFGTKIKGHILLTEHHDEASFRNLKVRALAPKQGAP